MTKQDRSMQPRYVALREARQQRILAKAATPEGWGRKDFIASHSDTLVRDAKELVAAGRLFAAPISGGNRFFSTRELRDAFVLAKAKKSRGRPAGPGTKLRAAFGPDDAPKNLNSVKVQRAPTPKGRFEVDYPIVGGFMTQWHELRAAR